MALIPAGSFVMGNCMDTNEGTSAELPLHSVYVSAFQMDKYPVTQLQWDRVKAWSELNGYAYDPHGSAAASNHPMGAVSWFNCVKWCNARSQMEGLAPVYYTGTNFATVFKTNRFDNPVPNWSANGYRLPTEAEWEKAARGGAAGHRFPWSDVDTIDHTRANYQSVWSGGHPAVPYDVNPTNGYYAGYFGAHYGGTTPVGYFGTNGYGLCDMAGNVAQWCWDHYEESWYGRPEATLQDTHGPVASGWCVARVVRGGGWDARGTARGARCASRGFDNPCAYPGRAGFRCVRGW
jgi:formylglycine-generating enzyme